MLQERVPNKYLSLEECQKDTAIASALLEKTVIDIFQAAPELVKTIPSPWFRRFSYDVSEIEIESHGSYFKIHRFISPDEDGNPNQNGIKESRLQCRLTYPDGEKFFSVLFLDEGSDPLTHVVISNIHSESRDIRRTACSSNHPQRIIIERMAESWVVTANAMLRDWMQHWDNVPKFENECFSAEW